MLWNIESKIDAQFPNSTLGVQDFVQRQHALFVRSGYKSSITVRLHAHIYSVRERLSAESANSTRASTGGRSLL